MTPLDITHIALVIVGTLVVVLWLLPAPCRCEHCGFHIEERRVKQVRAKEIEHDAAHKGFGYDEGDRDIMNCTDDQCSRNKRKGKEE